MATDTNLSIASTVQTFTRYRNPLLIGLTILLIIWRIYESWPPEKIVIAAGPKGGFYDTTSLEIRRLLQAKGINVEILNYTETSKIIGDVNDLKSPISLGFLAQKIEAGVYKNVISLGSIMKDPLFIFQRLGLALTSPAEFRDLKVGVSPKNTGSRAITDIVLMSYGILPDSANLIPLSLFEMQRAVEEGTIDVGFFLQPATNTVVASLGERGLATLVQTEHAQSITKKFGHLSAVTIAKGSFSVIKNLPAKDTQMVAVPVTVIAKHDLHPAIVTALALALKEIVASPTLISVPGEFPSMEIEHTFEDSSRAAEIYKLGTSNEPFLYRHLPFKVAGVLDSLTLILSVLVSVYVILLHLLEPLKLWLEKKPLRQLHALEDLHALAQSRALTQRELAKAAAIEEYFELHHNAHGRSTQYAREIKKLHLKDENV